MKGMIYLLQDREFISNGQAVFKIGRTINISKRLSQYPKGSELLMCLRTDNLVAFETHLIKLFRGKFISRTDIGSEYFQGDHIAMIELITDVVCHCKISFSDAKDDDVKKCNVPKDVSLLIQQFIEENKSKYSVVVEKSINVYLNFVTWLQNKNYDVQISHNKMSRELYNVYGVISKTHRFDTKLDKALLFPNLFVAPKEKSIIESHLEKAYEITHNPDDFVNVTEVRQYLLENCKLQISSQKMKKDLLRDLKLVEDHYKYDPDGKRLHVFRGIKRIQEPNESTPSNQVNVKGSGPIIKYLLSLWESNSSIKYKEIHGAELLEDYKMFLKSKLVFNDECVDRLNNIQVGLELKKIMKEPSGINKTHKRHGVYYIITISELKTFLESRGLNL